MIENLPDAETEISTDPVTAYVQGCEARLRSVAEAYEAGHTEELWRKLVDASRAFRRAKLKVDGIECDAPGCGEGDGTLPGQVFLGWEQPDLRHPAEPGWGECSKCLGEGYVLPPEEEI